MKLTLVSFRGDTPFSSSSVQLQEVIVISMAVSSCLQLEAAK
jgi:hypothetical protein